jgi:hypothetical protein
MRDSYIPAELISIRTDAESEPAGFNDQVTFMSGAGGHAKGGIAAPCKTEVDADGFVQALAGQKRKDGLRSSGTQGHYWNYSTLHCQSSDSMALIYVHDQYIIIVYQKCPVNRKIYCFGND